jgi:hypothetical protein
MFDLQKGMKTPHTPASRLVPLFSSVPMGPENVLGLPTQGCKKYGLPNQEAQDT